MSATRLVARGRRSLARGSWLVALLSLSTLLTPGLAAAASRIVSMSPDTGPATGGTHVIIKVEGGVTVGPWRVQFGNREAAKVTRLDLSTVEAVAPPGDPGPVSVEVVNGLWGTRTAPAVFTYQPSAPPGPQLLRLEPSVVPVGSGELVLHAEGEAFGADSRLQVGDRLLPTTVLSPQRLEVHLPADLLARARTLAVSVAPAGSGGTAPHPLALTVANPIPEMTVLEAPEVAAGDPRAAVTVRGRDFRPDTQVQVGGEAVPTTYKGPEELTAVLPAGVLAAPGRLAIRVLTPGPGGGASNPATLTVRPQIPGRFIAFTSNRRGGHDHIYLLDRETGRLDILEEANSWSATDDYPSISADGRFIVFQSDRHHGQFDVFLFDRQTRKLDPLPELNSPTAFDGFPRLSADGRFIVFESDRLNGRPKVFLFDRQTRTLSAVARANDPAADDGLAAISN